MAHKEDFLAKPEALQSPNDRTRKRLIAANIEKKLYLRRSEQKHVMLPKLRPLSPSSPTTDATFEILKRLAENPENSVSISESMNSIIASLEDSQGYRFSPNENEERDQGVRPNSRSKFIGYLLSQGFSKKLVDALINHVFELTIQEQELRSKIVVIKEEEILKLIERQPLTLQNIADSFNVPIKDVYPVVRQLFNRGFIDKLNGTILQKIFPFIGYNRRRKTWITDPNTHFTLTLKGFFKLNPIITANK